jgi:serine/threonine-protein kinase
MVTVKEALSEYWLDGTIGKGARSTIYRATRKSDGRRLAVKFVQVENDEDRRVLSHLENEYDVLEALQACEGDGADVVVRPEDFQKVRRWFRTKAAYLVMEYVAGDSLAQSAEYELPETLQIFLEVCRGLQFVHGCGYVHGDLKPDNIVVEEPDSVKLLDFGFAGEIGTRVKGFKGTWGYVAPEQAGGKLTPRTDVFNCGAAMHWVLTGEKMPSLVPDEGGKGGFVPDRELTIRPPVQWNKDIPVAVSDMVVRCCAPEISRRPHLQEVKQVLNDTLLHMEMSSE